MRRQLPHGASEDAATYQARTNLTTFVIDQAEQAQTRVGFGWRAARLAPSTYPDVLREHKMSGASGLPYRVSSRHCQNTIFTSPGANHAMRFWHHMSHVRFGLTFSADDEMELGCYHLETLRDTIGQTLCLVMLGRFPADQLRFATTAIQLGLDVAIAEEASVVTAPTNVECEASVRPLHLVRRRGRSWNSRHDLGGDAA